MHQVALYITTFIFIDRALSSLKKAEDKVEETHTWKKDITLIMSHSILSHIRKDKLYKKNIITVRCFPYSFTYGNKQRSILYTRENG